MVHPISMTWIGGGNNQASNPEDWSSTNPTGGFPPTTPYIMTMTTGTMNISGMALDPVPISFGIALEVTNGIENINMSNGAEANIFSTNTASPTINVSGTKNLLAVGGTSATVDLAKNSEWIGRFIMNGGPGGLTVNSSMGATFMNENWYNTAGDPGSIVFGVGSYATINANIGGTGQLSAENGGKITLNGSVSKYQTVSLDANNNYVGPQGESPGVVDIKNWKTFLGIVQLGKGEIELDGVKNAKTYAYDAKDDLLSIWGNGKNPIATLRLEHSQVPSDSPGLKQFFVASTTSGVSVYTSDVQVPGKILGLHTI